MSENELGRGKRALAQIEAALLKAEAEYADADERLRAAQLEREAALDAINNHQGEFDEAFAKLRQRSTPGSKWRAQRGTDDVLALRPEDAFLRPDVEPSASVLPEPKLRSVSAQFDRLKFYAKSEENDGGPPSPNGGAA